MSYIEMLEPWMAGITYGAFSLVLIITLLIFERISNARARESEAELKRDQAWQAQQAANDSHVVAKRNVATARATAVIAKYELQRLKAERKCARMRAIDADDLAAGWSRLDYVASNGVSSELMIRIATPSYKTTAEMLLWLYKELLHKDEFTMHEAEYAAERMDAGARRQVAINYIYVQYNYENADPTFEPKQPYSKRYGADAIFSLMWLARLEIDMVEARSAYAGMSDAEQLKFCKSYWLACGGHFQSDVLDNEDVTDEDDDE